jgi:hypothetical protein
MLKFLNLVLVDHSDSCFLLELLCLFKYEDTGDKKTRK